jgi:hypothetical protein
MAARVMSPGSLMIGWPSPSPNFRPSFSSVRARPEKPTSAAQRAKTIIRLDEEFATLDPYRFDGDAAFVFRVSLRGKAALHPNYQTPDFVRSSSLFLTYLEV